MSALSSAIPSAEPAKRASRGAVAPHPLVRDLRARTAKGLDASPNPEQATRLTARRRVERLIDPGAPFLEFGALAQAGLIAGIGRTAGREVMLLAEETSQDVDPSLAIAKRLRALEIAERSSLACVHLLSGEAAPARASTSAVTIAQARLTAAGAPVIAAAFDGAVQSGSALIALADETVSVGPGGDHVARNDAHALALLRRVIARLPARSLNAPHRREPRETRAPFSGPAYEGDIDAAELFADLLDASDVQTFRPEEAQSITAGFGHLWGLPVAVMADKGALTTEAARKAADFVTLADQRDLPMLTFFGGTSASAPDDLSHAAPLITALAQTQSPRITVLTEGGGDEGLYGRASHPDFLFAWPTENDAAYSAAANLTVDAVIAPEDTRRVAALAAALRG